MWKSKRTKDDGVVRHGSRVTSNFNENVPRTRSRQMLNAEESVMSELSVGDGSMKSKNGSIRSSNGNTSDEKKGKRKRQRKKMTESVRIRRFHNRAVADLEILDTSDEAKQIKKMEKIMLDQVEGVIENIRVGKFPFYRFQGGTEEVHKLLDQRYRFEIATRFRGIWKALVLCSIIFHPIYLIVVWNYSSVQFRILYGALVCILPFVYAIINSSVWIKYNQIVTLILTSILGCVAGAFLVQGNGFSNMLWSLVTLVILTSSPLLAINSITITGLITLILLGYGIANVLLLNDDGVNSDYSGFSLLSWAAFIIVLYVTLVFTALKRESSQKRTVISRFVALSKSRQVERQVEHTKNLLQSMVPDSVAKKLKDGSSSNMNIADQYENTTVLFVEVDSFNRISAEQTQTEVVEILNVIFHYFDVILQRHKAYKVETVGPVYMACTGCPRRSFFHAEEAACLALDFFAHVELINDAIRRKIPNIRRKIQLRLGLNSGPVVAGVIGLKAPRFKLIGDTVNCASRMESTAVPGTIQCSDSTASILENARIFNLEHRGKIKVKGKGEMNTYFLKQNPDQRLPDLIPNPDEVQIFKSEDDSDDEDNDVAQTITNQSDKSQNTNRGVAKESWTLCQSFTGVLKACCCWEVSTKVAPDNSSMSFGRTAAASSFSMAAGTSFKSNQVTIERTEILKFAGAVKSAVWCRDLKFRQNQIVKSFRFWKKLCFVLSILSILASLGGLVIFLSMGPPRGVSPGYYLMFIGVLAGYSMYFFTLYVLIVKKMYRIGQLWLMYGFLGFATMLVFVNVSATRINSSAMMALCTFFFYFQQIHLKYRILFTIIGSVGYSGALTYVVYQNPNYYLRFKFDEAIPEYVTVNDIFIQASFIFGTILIQALNCAAHEALMMQEFRRGSLIKSQNKELERQRERSRSIMLKLLPESIVDRLLANPRREKPIVDRFESVSTLFTDLVGFTAMSKHISPTHLMEFLNSMYAYFDKVSEAYGLYKVEIIGDAYFAVAGCPVSSMDHAERMVRAAHEMLSYTPQLQRVVDQIMRAENFQGEIPKIAIRVGINSGTVVAGCVGKVSLRYHVFGDAVELANMMESEGVPGRVHISYSTLHALQRTAPDFTVEARSNVDLRPLGPIQETYFVEPPAEEIPPPIEEKVCISGSGSGETRFSIVGKKFVGEVNNKSDTNGNDDGDNNDPRDGEMPKKIDHQPSSNLDDLVHEELEHEQKL